MTYNEVKEAIESMERGSIFFPDDFGDDSAASRVRMSLSRLCKSGIIQRVAQGVYYYPRFDIKWGLGVLHPDIDDIARAVAARDHVRILPTGAYALNLLGLSTQMPTNVVYISDGSQRRLKLNNGRSILFKHTSEMKMFAYRSSLMQLIVSALREIGEGNVKEEQLAIVKEHLQHVGKANLENDLQLAPAWVRKILKQ